MASNMKCYFSECRSQVESVCTNCSPQRNYCRDHAIDHFAKLKHYSISLKDLSWYEHEIKKTLKKKIRESISQVIKISEGLIEEINSISKRTIMDLVKLNAVARDVQSLVTISIRKDDFHEALRRIKNIFQIGDQGYCSSTEDEKNQNKISNPKGNFLKSNELENNLGTSKNSSVDEPKLLWACARCSFENDSRQEICMVCFSEKEKKVEPKKQEMWTCSTCTAYNDFNSLNCFLCESITNKKDLRYNTVMPTQGPNRSYSDFRREEPRSSSNNKEKIKFVDM